MERQYGSYNGRRRHSSRRSSSQKVSGHGKTMISLCICAGIFLTAVIIKVAFPSVMETINTKMAETMDFKSAFTALGQGISGKKEFAAALEEAYIYAFKGGEDKKDKPVSVNIDVVDIASGLDKGRSMMSGLNTTATEQSNETPQPVESEQDRTRSAIESFLESQSAFSDELLPENVTYDYKELDFDYTLPVQGIVTSTFGFRIHPVENAMRFHYGTDVGADEGTDVAAFASGTVLAAGESSSLGNYIIINHDGVESEYGHLSEILVSEGETVSVGDVIGRVGETGNATGPCLHFELEIDGEYVNPEYYLSWT